MAANNPQAAANCNDEQIRRRRQFTQKLNLRRQVYRELTSYQVFPLQEMAMKDLDEKLKDYLSSGGDKLYCKGGKSDVDGETGLGVTSSDSPCVAETNETESNDLYHLREKFLNEFLRERSIPPVAITSISASVTLLEGKDLSGCGSPKNHRLPLDSEQDTHQASEDSQDEHFGKADISECPVKSEEDLHPRQHQNLSCRSNLSPPKEQQCNSADDQAKSQIKIQQCEDLVSNTNTSTPTEQQCNTIPATTFLPLLWSMEPRIFACETSSTGKRRYISAHLGRFMDHYWRECDVYTRHYYELIREDTPCRLYFDLEFNKSSNPELTTNITESLLTELFNEIKHQFETIYQVKVHRHHLVDLDSSTPKKFSRHWIFHLPDGRLFNDARAAGVFVKLLAARLEDEQTSGKLKSKGHEILQKHLFVNAEDSREDDVKLTRFIDMGVYTRNRLFRLLGSTKYGKRPDAALRIANANEFPFPERFSNANFYLPEFRNSDDETSDACKAQNDQSESDYERFCSSHNWEDHATALESTMVVPAHTGQPYTKVHFTILPDLENLLEYSDQQKLNLVTVASRARSLISEKQKCSYGKSPFPCLENFIVNKLGRRKGLEGSIGTFSLGVQQPLPRTISYNMKGNRWCENIGRSHKSNNIIWNVHLTNRVCWQCCHDPDCRGFRGEQIDLPEEVNAEIDEYFLDRELSLLNIDDHTMPKEQSSNHEFDDPVLEKALSNLQINAVGGVHEGPEEGNEKRIDDSFDDPSLEEAMCKLDISSL